MVRDHSCLQQRNNSNQAISNPWMSFIHSANTYFLRHYYGQDSLLAAKNATMRKTDQNPWLAIFDKTLQYLWLTSWNIFIQIHISFCISFSTKFKNLWGQGIISRLIPIFSVATFMPCIEWALKIYWHWVKE